MRRWLAHLWREWTIESWRPIAPAFAKPEPLKWNDAQVTAAWIGHATVLINFFGIKILTDPVLFPRVGIRLPGFTIGPKRLTAPALEFHELPELTSCFYPMRTSIISICEHSTALIKTPA